MEGLLTTESLTRLSAGELARRIAAGEVTSLEVVEAHLQRIIQVNSQLNAVVVPLFEEARGAAKAADDARSRGLFLGALQGVPITIKECFHVAGTPSAIGIDGFRDDVFENDGPLVARLRRAGAIIVGKTNVPQAMLLHETDNPLHGRTNNPWNLDRSPGGSSGGEAAILASGGSSLGLANDLGGSIRQPAHVCGICGIMPTAGRLTNRGCRNNFGNLKLIATQSGVLARHVSDLQLALQVLVQRGENEPVDADETDRPLGDFTTVNVADLRIGFFVDDGYFRPSPAIRRAVLEAGNALSALGAEIVEFAPPDVAEALRIYFSLLGADGAATLTKLLAGSRMDPRIARLLRIGRLGQPWRKLLTGLAIGLGQSRMATLLSATGLKSANQMREIEQSLHAYRQRFFMAMQAAGIDALIFPPHGLPAPTHGSTQNLTPTASYCYLANLLGIPAGTVAATRVRRGEETDRPRSFDRVERTARRVEQGSVGLPIGVQVAARLWREDLVLAVMAALEQAFRSQPDYPWQPPL